MPTLTVSWVSLRTGASVLLDVFSGVEVGFIQRGFGKILVILFKDCHDLLAGLDIALHVVFDHDEMRAERLGHEDGHAAADAVAAARFIGRSDEHSGAHSKALALERGIPGKLYSSVKHVDVGVKDGAREIARVLQTRCHILDLAFDRLPFRASGRDLEELLIATCQESIDALGCLRIFLALVLEKLAALGDFIDDPVDLLLVLCEAGFGRRGPGHALSQASQRSILALIRTDPVGVRVRDKLLLLAWRRGGRGSGRVV